MNMQKLRTVIILIMVIVLSASCQIPKADPGKKAEGAPGSVIEGGNDELTDINIKNAVVNENGDSVDICFLFKSVSAIADPDAAGIDSVPAYSISNTEAPYRIIIKLKSIELYEYVNTSNLTDNSFVCGAYGFHSNQDNAYHILLQLNFPVTVSVNEDKSDLHIILNRDDLPAESQQYYVLYDMFDAYASGDLSADGMLPTLCSDYEHMILISQGFEEADDAEELKSLISSASDNPDVSPIVDHLNTNELPSIDSVNTKPVKHSVALYNGEELILYPEFENAVYAATGPSGDVVYVRTISPSTSLDTEDVTVDEIWISKKGASNPVLLDTGIEFYGITDAVFSHDGKYLAILDSSKDNAVLYLYDFESNKLVNTGEEGFGTFTTGFSWDLDNNTIYAMAGPSDAIQLLKFDPDDPDSGVTAIEEEPGFISSITYAGGYIYCINDETSELIRIKAEANGSGTDIDVNDKDISSSDDAQTDSGESDNSNVQNEDDPTPKREIISPAVSFRLSPDGKKAMVLYNDNSDRSEIYSLYLIDLESLKSELILENIDPETWGFLPDGKQYYIMENKKENRSSFPYELLIYDSSKLINSCDIKSEMLTADRTTGSFYITLYSVIKGELVPNTYRFDLSGNSVSE